MADTQYIKTVTKNGYEEYVALPTGGVAAHDQAWSTITDTPTTLAGYGITDGGAGMTYPAAGIALSDGGAWLGSITNNSANWNTAYTDRLKWDGGSTDLVAATGRTSLGATTAGASLFMLANPGAITFLRVNADNSVSALSAVNFKGALSLENVTNESKATMFATPTLTGSVTITNAGESDINYIDTTNTQNWQVGTNAVGYYIYETGVDYRLVVKKTTGYVGINTSAPGGALDVRGALSLFGTSQGQSYFYDDTLNFGYADNANHLGYINYVGYNNGITQFRDLAICDGKHNIFAFFDGSSGRVGVGITVPDYKFDVTGDIAVGGVGNHLYFDTTGVRGGCSLYVDNDYWLNLFCNRGTSSKIVLKNTPAISFETGGSARMTLSDAGLSIGTTAPNFQMQLHGSGASYFQITKAGTGSAATDGTIMGYDGGAGDYTFYIRQRENAAMCFYTNDTERITIQSDGWIAVNKTTAYEVLDVYGNIACSNELTFDTTTNATANGYINYHGYQGGNSQYRNLYVYNGKGSAVAYFDGAASTFVIGTVGVTFGGSNEMWYRGTAVDDAAIYINHRGYNDTYSNFRDLRIGDGKGNPILYIDGSTGFTRNYGFTSGWNSGSGWMIDTSGNAEFNNVLVRGGMQVYEMIINQLHYQNGGLVIGAGAGKVKSVYSSTVGSEQLYFETPEGTAMSPFSAGAIVIVWRVDINRSTVVKKIVRQVSAIQGDQRVDMTTTTGWTTGSDVGVFEAGDEVCTIGHTSTASLQNSIYFSAIDTDNPFMRIYSGVSSWAKWSLTDKTTIRVQLGNLASLASYDIVPASPGYGLYCDNVYLKGKIEASSGKIGTWNINSTSIYTGTEDHSAYTGAAGDLTIYSDGSDASIHGYNFYIDTGGNLYAKGGTIGGFSLSATQIYYGSGSSRVELNSGGFMCGGEATSAASFVADQLGRVKVTTLIYAYQVDNTVYISHDALAETNATSATKMKTITMGSYLIGDKTIRVKFTLEAKVYSGVYVYAQIYVNGTAVGTLRSTNSAGGTEYSEDITGVSSGESIQLYAYTASSGTYAEVYNFRVCGSHITPVNEASGSSISTP